MLGTLALEYAVACLRAMEHELLLFAAFWFILGALDDFGVDLCWIWLRLTGRGGDGRLAPGLAARPLAGRTAVLIAAWREGAVIGHTIGHALSAWRQEGFTLYLGCYCNDPETIAAAMAAAGADPRVRVVISESPGPTTKADCLNRVYAALCQDEERYGRRYGSVVIHDSEDMVHPAELAVIDMALEEADFVQLPVCPEPQPDSPWVAGHYADEFAEAHAKAMVVRDALGASIPAAGVGCGFSREMIARIARRRGGEGRPFAAECLTEDYELGLLVRREGGRSRFLRLRDERGDLVATRSFFPARLEDSVRQKSRWIHGIAFQGWDRLGWSSGAAELWMALRDRRGPLTAIVLACGYCLFVIEGLLALASLGGASASVAMSPLLHTMIQLCLAGFLWRAAFRVLFTTREYGIVEGLGAVMRIPVANFIAIFAGRRALASYVLSLRGLAVRWEKTEHAGHPALGEPMGALAR
ncbi:glycosyl transferase family protein [Novosphingobium sp. BL-52-GroH]|uniref:glycosyl transferase family protein n=1 Tax=Novosphingobium sp. BL-52-GroH TaxID=3349877 RepID=UPI003851025E